jgi:hypothetical protein
MHERPHGAQGVTISPIVSDVSIVGGVEVLCGQPRPNIVEPILDRAHVFWLPGGYLGSLSIFVFPPLMAPWGTSWASIWRVGDGS